MNMPHDMYILCAHIFIIINFASHGVNFTLFVGYGMIYQNSKFHDNMENRISAHIQQISNWIGLSHQLILIGAVS